MSAKLCRYVCPKIKIGLFVCCYSNLTWAPPYNAIGITQTSAEVATAAGICTDKSLLLAGKPTVNVALLLEVAEMIRAHRDAESERQHQQAKALLSLPANQP